MNRLEGKLRAVSLARHVTSCIIPLCTRSIGKSVRLYSGLECPSCELQLCDTGTVTV